VNTTRLWSSSPWWRSRSSKGEGRQRGVASVCGPSRDGSGAGPSVALTAIAELAVGQAPAPARSRYTAPTMAPPRTGAVEKRRRADGRVYFRARIRLADGSRERVDVPAKAATPSSKRVVRPRRVVTSRRRRHPRMLVRRAVPSEPRAQWGHDPHMEVLSGSSPEDDLEMRTPVTPRSATRDPLLGSRPYVLAPARPRFSSARRASSPLPASAGRP